MRGRNFITSIFLFTLCSFSYCKTSTIAGAKQGVIKIAAADKHIQYEGRITHQNDFARLYWPGTSVTIRFRGKAIKAVLQDFNGQNHFNVVLDSSHIHRIKIDSLKKEYVLAEGLAEGEHTLSLIKITQIHKEYKRGYTDFFGFEVDVNTKLLTSAQRPSRKMEFYGNSITCGHGILDSSGGDRGASIFENNYLSYAALTARHFNARYRCIAKSGIGVMVSFGDLIMSEMYNRTNPFDSLSTWNFNEYIPDIVVVNLLQNDQGILNRPEYVQYKRRFGATAPTKEFIVQSYQKLISKLRGHYPRATIICVMGSMDATKEGSPWPGYVREAIGNLRDPKIYSHFFSYKGSPKHPLIKDHEVMAKSLIRFIDQNVKW